MQDRSITICPWPFLPFDVFSSKTSTANVAVAVVSETMAAVAVVSPPASGTPPWPRLADDGPVAGGVQGPRRWHLHGHRGRRWLLFCFVLLTVDSFHKNFY